MEAPKPSSNPNDAAAKTTLADLAYPPKLREAERAMHERAKVGVAISGGGIRSATFALGVFQAIARLKLLGSVDYMSTVSGGGYFGAFLGRLFTRDYVAKVDDVQEILTGPHATNPPNPDVASQARWKVLGWLRENGRYLAPRGAGDLLLGGAAFLRNWLSVLVVLATMFLMVLLVLQAPRYLPQVHGWWDAGSAAGRYWPPVRNALPFARTWIWWSPWSVPALLFFALAVPIGWAYWLVRGEATREFDPRRRRWPTGAVGAGIVVLIGVAGLVNDLTSNAHGPLTHIAEALGVAAVLTFVVWGLCHLRIRFDPNYETADPAQPAGKKSEQAIAFEHAALMKRHLSNWLKVILIAGAALGVLAIVDSVGQTAYAALHTDRTAVQRLGVAAAALFTALSGIARQLVVLAGPKKQRVSLPASILAGVVAVVLSFLLLTAVDVLAQAVTWDFGPPNVPAGILASCGSGTVTLSAPSSQTVVLTSAPGAAPCRGVTGGGGRIAPKALAFWLVAIAAVMIAVGNAFTFLNDSSMQTLYSARLTRAYLGASNPERWSRDGPVPVIEPLAGDDIEVHSYWPPIGKAAVGSSPDPPSLYRKGMPLHLVNVTVNETVDGQSQVEQLDRKGLGMALGPAGMSVGIRHHVVLREDEGRDRRHVNVSAIFPPPGDFRVFEYGDETQRLIEFPWEPLSLGRWIGISGAAFSTGLGYRTSLGLSVLAGLANVRLGYWWDSGVRPFARSNDVSNRARWVWPRAWTACAANVFSRLARPLSGWRRRVVAALRRKKSAPEPTSEIAAVAVTPAGEPSPAAPRRRTRLDPLHLAKWAHPVHWMPVQIHLLSELLARFPGTARRYWYLSDGGHFENMGGYELVRRRLPLVVVLDGEADPDYTFEGLSNLVRKARLDFQAEITFKDAAWLADHGLRPAVTADGDRVMFGTLDELRPDRKSVAASDDEGALPLSRARCALAEIRYPPASWDARQTGWLLYVKPTLTGDEPADVVQYARANRPFPQQTTADQFFDEAQWESYRKLGDHIAALVFGATGLDIQRFETSADLDDDTV